jgi:hypothetical protein
MKKRITKALVLGATLGFSVTTSVGLAWGQAKAPLQRSPSAPTEVSDKELHAFAKSYIEFHKLRTVYEPQLNVAKTPEEKTRIQQEAVAKFGAALEREGLTMERYGALFQTVNADDHLREKVLKLIEDEKAKS